MTIELAPRPANEERRAKAVVKTGMFEHDQGGLFQIYCDLAQAITGFTIATFSLFDADHQCHIAATGRETEGKSVHNVHDVYSYVLLSPDPLLAPDLSESEQFKHFIRLCCDFEIDMEASVRLKASGLAEATPSGKAGLSSQGRQLQFEMGLQTKVMNKIKITGDQANIMLDDMLSLIGGL